MHHPYREPQIEDGVHNIILQNRCGNRCSFLVYPDRAEFEFVYKPNAFRRKDFRGRNFSNRDNQTSLFTSFVCPDLGTETADFTFEYDPFHTQVAVAHHNQARNRLQLLNLAEANAFALTSRGPLLLALHPHQWQGEFAVSDGCLMETFRDRGEDIVSFVAFRSFEENRFRVLDDGTYILQLLENDVLLVGAEENSAQVTRLLRRYEGLDFAALCQANEAALAPDLALGHAELDDPEFQRVLDLNRRVTWSGLDAGGACFGAINRVYFLIWVRDGSMTSSHMALAGHPEFLRIWAPFLWANPSRTLPDEGERFEEFGQMVGTRWSKAEDDGLFYGVWSLFTHFRTTGDDALLRRGMLERMVRLIEAHWTKCWNDELGVMVSDTLGEESLRGSPYFSFDVVNGSLKKALSHTTMGGKAVEHVASFYHQVNTYNVLRMAACLLDEGGADSEQAGVFRQRAETLAESLRTGFLDEQGLPFAMIVSYEGEEGWHRLELDILTSDMWEYVWALSQGPFYPLPEAQIKAGLVVIEKWPTHPRRSYGLCPWNVLVRFLHEMQVFDAPTAEGYLRDQVKEALEPTQKFPMLGALHESHREQDYWRALPFTAGSFTVAQTGRLLAPLAQGLAVREGGMTQCLRDFRYRLSSIQVDRNGGGPRVSGWMLNGERVAGSLQVPEQRLRAGRNQIMVELGSETPKIPTLYQSDAELLEVSEVDGQRRWRLRSAVESTLYFVGVPADWKPQLEASEAGSAKLEVSACAHPEGVRVCVEVIGEFTLKAKT